MRVERACLHVATLPMRRFETSFGVVTSRTVPLLELFEGGEVGVAEGVMDSELPLYREETVASAMPLVRRMLTDHVVGKDFGHPSEFTDRVAHLRGNRMAKALIEMALWDLWARELRLPLRDVLGGSGDEVPCGISIGIQPSVAATVEAVGAAIEQGYRRVKLKIKPSRDLLELAAVRAAHPHAVLAADANSAYTLEQAEALVGIDGLGLEYVEQPLAWDDIVDHGRLQGRMATPICLDESVVDVKTARFAAETAAIRVVNVKVGRVGGYAETLRLDAVAQELGLALWCGGVLMTGVGRAHTIQTGTLPSFSKVSDMPSAQQYLTADVVEQELSSTDGLMPVPTAPGVGVTLDHAALRRVGATSETF